MKCGGIGPLLFNIYVNDLPVNTDSSFNDGLLFANDFGLKVSCSSKLDVSNALIKVLLY